MTTHTDSAVVMQARPRDTLKLLSLVLTLIGLAISGYIVIAELTNTQTACPQTSTFNCDLVQHSLYSKVGPIPVAYLGLGGYIFILLVLLLEGSVPFLAERGKLIVFAVTLFGVLFSGYLTAIEAFVLHAWCLWCVGSAITMTLLFVVSLVRLWRGPADEDFEDDETEA
jgi:uncharacterized membrane protein